MADLDDIYNTKLLELAGAISHHQRLDDADAHGDAVSKLCGSHISVDIAVKDQVITDYGQTVKACLLGQAAASVVGREIVGTHVAEFRTVAKTMRDMLKADGPPPTGRWADLKYLEPVRHYKARHASTLLVFDAVEKAIEHYAAAATPSR